MWFPTNWRWDHLLSWISKFNWASEKSPFIPSCEFETDWQRSTLRLVSCSRNIYYPVRPWDSPRVHQVVWRGCTVQQEEEIWLHRSLPLGKVSFFHVKKKAKEQKRRSWTKLFALIGKVPIFFHFEIWPFHPQGALSISFFIPPGSTWGWQIAPLAWKTRTQNNWRWGFEALPENIYLTDRYLSHQQQIWQWKYLHNILYKGGCQKRFSGFCPLRGYPPPPHSGRI